MQFVKKHRLILLPVLVMVAIWVFSAMNGVASDAQSVPLASFLGIPNGLMRKAAHFIMFACLGALWYNYIRNGGFRKFTPGFTFALSLLLTAVYACADETHQLFVPGRSGEIGDILIDSVAGLTGTIIFAGIYYLTRSKAQKAARRQEVEKIWKQERKRWQRLERRRRGGRR